MQVGQLMTTRTTVFISYSHNDKKWLGHLKTHLNPLERDGLINIWDDTQIKEGADWSQETKEALSTTTVAILLISAEFLASEFITTNELPHLLTAAEAQGTLILPIIVSACDFKHSELHKFQAFNSPEKPMSRMRRSSRDALLLRVVDRVREVADGIHVEANNSGFDNETEIPPQQFEAATNSILVLPFRSENGDLDNLVFCDGLTEELVNTFSRIKELKVASITSSRFYQNKQVDFSEVRSRLHVGWILEGSVRRAQSDLRIAAHLVDTDEGYIRESVLSVGSTLDHKFDTQIRIAAEIVEAVKEELGIAAEPSAVKRNIVKSKAYDSYQYGCYFFYQHAGDGWLKAIEYFEKATSIEPEYASAYARLSSVLAFAWFYGTMHPDEAIDKWRNTNERALELGSDLAETHIAVGRFRLLYERNWKAAEREYKQAAEIDYKNADAYQQYGLLLAAKGQFQEAITEARKALRHEPLSLLVNFHAAAIYWLSSQWDMALQQIEHLLDLFPGSNSAYWVKGLIYSMTGNYEKAIESYLESLELRDDNHALSSLAFTYGLSGKTKEALRIIDKLIERNEQRYSIGQNAPYATAYNVAAAYGGLRKSEEAFTWLMRAYRERNGDLIYLKVHSTIGGEGLWGKEFRNDQRFRDFLRLVGFD